MATVITTLDSGLDGTLAGVKSWRKASTTLTGTPAGVTTTYYYREAGGTRGSTTTIGAIPVGAVVERRVTA